MKRRALRPSNQIPVDIQIYSLFSITLSKASVFEDIVHLMGQSSKF
ncbi:hypothetical protein M6B38_377500 [Iris pallida]|uniref:Uncharacterized protein n=1 Tax=Iris pallida TaxID=29817 RepID=A0AAX6GBK6_IRIPA|nr:hypothetical protein M6B38_377500 [Iris pallida]